MEERRYGRRFLQFMSWPCFTSASPLMPQASEPADACKAYPTACNRNLIAADFV